MMKPLKLDFLRSARRPGRAGILLIALAVAIAGKLFHTYLGLRNEIEAKETQIARSKFGAARGEASPGTAPSPDGLRFARDTVQRLSTPWGRLFDALEAAQSDRVSLLSIEPDADGGKVTVTGEAKDYLAVLSYVANLSLTGGMRNAHLTRHEVRQNDPHQPVAFAVSAAWRNAP